MTLHYHRARELMEVRRYDLAEKALRDELAAEPNSANAHLMLSECLQELDRSDEAGSECDEAIRLAPDFAHAHYVRSWILQRRKLWTMALTPAKEAVRLAPAYAGYLGNLAFVYYILGRYGHAAHFANEGLQHDPNHVRCLNALALAAAALGKHRKAHDFLKQALAQNPNDDATYTNLGYVMLLADKKSAALEYYTESLRLDPNDKATQDRVVGMAKEQIFGRLFVAPGALTLVASILLMAVAFRREVGVKDGVAPVLFWLLIFEAATVCLPVISLAFLSPVHLLRLNLVCREWVSEAARCARWSGLGSVLTTLLAFAAAYWVDTPAMLLPAVAAWAGTHHGNILAFRELSRKPRVLLTLYEDLVSVVGLMGIGLLAARCLLVDPVWAGCSHLSYMPLCFYVLGSFYVGLFLYTFAPRTPTNPS
jgi:tetratricopeptide (TPR) repeat protein